MRTRKNKLFKGIKSTIILIILIFTMIYITALFTIPSHILIVNGEDYVCNFKTPISVGLLAEKQAGLHLNGSSISASGTKLNLMSPFTIRSDSLDKVKLNFKLFGVIPLKSVMVEVVPNKSVIPCGNTIGVKIYTEGTLVVGMSEVYGRDGNIYEPYKYAGIKTGDYITEINGQKIESVADVVKIMEDNNGQYLTMKLIRNDTAVQTKIQPVLSSDNGYRIGLWLRDSTAGIGTMTFYDPETRAFGALGHGITDVDVGRLMTVNKGEILNSNIVSVKKGLKGSPGELRGIYLENKNTVGRIITNTQCGIFGVITDDKKIVPSNKPMPIALRSQIKEGPAQIISNIYGNSTTAYNIEILKVNRSSITNSKSMVLKITDDRLLNYTGGIVQGMSGSPIIQDGRLIGAVTHVLVNDPTKGYGVFIELMLQNIKNVPGGVVKNAS